MPATYEKIQSYTLGSAASSIDFTSIGSGYTDLRLVVVGTISNAGYDVVMRFNSDTGSNYSFTYLGGTGSAANSGRGTSTSNIQLNAGAGWSTTIPSMAAIDIFSYAGSTYKTALNLLSNDQNGSGSVNAIVGLWRSTSAITSVSIIGSSTNLQTGTTATLYGILKA